MHRSWVTVGCGPSWMGLRRGKWTALVSQTSPAPLICYGRRDKKWRAMCWLKLLISGLEKACDPHFPPFTLHANLARNRIWLKIKWRTKSLSNLQRAMCAWRRAIVCGGQGAASGDDRGQGGNAASERFFSACCMSSYLGDRTSDKYLQTFFSAKLPCLHELLNVLFTTHCTVALHHLICTWRHAAGEDGGSKVVHGHRLSAEMSWCCSITSYFM